MSVHYDAIIDMVHTGKHPHDQVTITKAPYIYLAKKGSPFSEPERKEAIQFLQRHNIRCVGKGQRLNLEIKDYFKATQLFEEEWGWEPRETPSYNTICTLMGEYLPKQYTLEDVKTRLGPILWETLRPFQRVAVLYAVNGKRYIADEMGAGKTIEGMVSAYFFPDAWPLVVVCPKSITNNWKQEFLTFLPKDFITENDIYLLGSTSQVWDIKQEQFKHVPEHKILIVTYGLLIRDPVKQFIIKQKYQGMILDEGHAIKHLKSARTQACLALKDHIPYRFILSGTPSNFSMDLYSQITFLSPIFVPQGKPANDFKSFEDYTKRYCKPTCKYVRGTPRWEYRGNDNKTEMEALLNTIMTRRRKKTILPHLPKKHRNTMYLAPLKKKEEAAIQELMNEAEEEKHTPGILIPDSSYQFVKTSEQWQCLHCMKLFKKKTAMNQHMYSNHPNIISKDPDLIKKTKWGEREKLMAAVRATATAKIPNVTEYIKTQLIEDLFAQEKELPPEDQTHALIFAHHQNMREAIEQVFDDHNDKHTEKQKIPYFVIAANTPQDKRQEYKNDFQAGKYRVAVLSITAASTGITLTRGSLVIFAELLWDPALHFQAEDRVHRLGQTRESNIIYLLQPNTSDRLNWMTICKKHREMSVILDGKEEFVQQKAYKVEESLTSITTKKTFQRQKKEKDQTTTDEKKVFKRRKKDFIPICFS